MALEITRTGFDPDGHIFRLQGRLDAIEAPTAYDRLIEDLGERRKVVLDLSGVDYMSSGGLSILIRLVHRLRSKGGDLYCAAPQPFVQKVFDIVSFDSILKVFEEVDTAVSAFGE